MEPLIYTSRGNIPESETVYSHEWFDGPEMTILREFWHARDNGELVKNNVHAMGKKGLSIAGEQAKM